MSVLVDHTVKGSFHQGDSIHFSFHSIGHQCMANAVAGAIYATMLPVHLWTPATLDRILIAGDSLYLQRCDSEYNYLQLSDIHSTERIFGDEYVINCSSPMTGLVESVREPSPPFFTLPQSISTMENTQMWTYGVLTLADDCNGASVLICVKEGNYYIFDTHSRDKYGNVVPNGTSVLLHFRNKNGLVRYIRNVANQLNASQFELTPLSPMSSGTYRMLHSTATTYNRSQTASSQNVDENLESKRKRVDSDKSDKSEQIQVGSSKPKRQEKKKTKVDNEHTDVTRITRSQTHKKEVDRDKFNIEKTKEKQKEQDRLKKKNQKKQQKENDDNEDIQIHRRYGTYSETFSQSDNTESQENVPIRRKYSTRSKTLSQSDNTQPQETVQICRRYNTRSQTLSQSDNTQSEENVISKQNINRKQKKRPSADIQATTSLMEHQSECEQSTLINESEYHDDISSNTTNDIHECLKLFDIQISNEPIYVCTVCLQTWFRRSVYDIEKLKITSDEEESKLNQCRRNFVSVENKEWICKTCRDSIKDGKIPRLSIENKMGFPPKPKELDLNGMEERFTAPRLTLFQMRDLPCGGQTSVRGNSVNLPIDIAPTVDMLPRTLDNTETIAINYKRRMCYKGCAFKKENIRPAAVWKAVNYLMRNSQMYKDLDIQLDLSWLQNIQPTNRCSCLEENLENTVEGEPEVSDENVSSQNIENCENIDNIEENEDIHNIDRDTMLSAPETIPRELTFAPGEGQHPISVFHDPDAEYLSFPTIFCGQRRPKDKERHSTVHYTEICKYELRSVDRRVATNIANVFFKLKKVQMKHVLDRVSLAMRRVKGKDVRAKNVLDDESRAKIVRLDEGYYIFRNLRNSPAYLEKRKKDAFAMIRQIGFPSLFISLSAAETKWPELLRAVGQLNGEVYTDQEIAEMNTQNKFRLIRKDSATVVRYFDYRFQTFLHDVLRSTHKPIGDISD